MVSLIKNRVLMLYDEKDFVIASFEHLSGAAKYLNLTENAISCRLNRNVRMRDGSFLMWVEV